MRDKTIYPYIWNFPIGDGSFGFIDTETTTPKEQWERLSDINIDWISVDILEDEVTVTFLASAKVIVLSRAFIMPSKPKKGHLKGSVIKVNFEYTSKPI